MNIKYFPEYPYLLEIKDAISCVSMRDYLYSAYFCLIQFSPVIFNKPLLSGIPDSKLL